jgi:hypothetical protein
MYLWSRSADRWRARSTDRAYERCFGESLMSDVVGVQATPSMPTASSYGNGARGGARTLRAPSPMTTIGLMPVEPDARVVTSSTRSAPSATTPPPHRPEERSKRIPDSRKNRTPWPHWGCDRSGGARSSYTCRASQRRHSLRRSWHRPVGRPPEPWGLHPRQIDQRLINRCHRSLPDKVHRVPIQNSIDATSETAPGGVTELSAPGWSPSGVAATAVGRTKRPDCAR